MVNDDLWRLMPSVPSSLPSTLSESQIDLLTVIAGPYLRDGTWPLWHYVQYHMDRRGLDAGEIVASLPRVGPQDVGFSYGFISGNWRRYGEEDRVRLTIAAALPLSELRSHFAEPYLRALHHMIALHRNVEPAPTEIRRAVLFSNELASQIPSLKPWFIADLPQILAGEPGVGLWSRSGPNPDDPRWHGEIGRGVQRYVKAKDLEDYVSLACAFVDQQSQEAIAQFASQRRSNVPASPVWTATATVRGETAKIELPSLEDRPVRVYAKEALIAELEALDIPALSTVKLVALLRELNLAFTNEMPFACSALLRAIMDHIPPGFGLGGFAAVVSNVGWTASEKKWLKGLTEFRVQGDDVMHRQMDKGRSWIDMHDIPAANALNALLTRLVAELKVKSAAARP